MSNSLSISKIHDLERSADKKTSRDIAYHIDELYDCMTYDGDAPNIQNYRIFRNTLIKFGIRDSSSDSVSKAFGPELVKFTTTLEKIEDKKVLSRHTEMFVEIEILSNKRSVYNLTINMAKAGEVKISGLINLVVRQDKEFKIDQKEIEGKILAENPDTLVANVISAILIKFINDIKIPTSVDMNWDIKRTMINALVLKNFSEYNLSIDVNVCSRFRKIVNLINKTFQTVCGRQSVVRGGSTFHQFDNIEIHVDTFIDFNCSIKLPDYRKVEIILNGFETSAAMYLYIRPDSVSVEIMVNDVYLEIQPHGNQPHEPYEMEFAAIDAAQTHDLDVNIFDIMRLVIATLVESDL